MQQQSRTENLITKTNYLKHKQKLQQIKGNGHNTSVQFYSSSKSRPLDRKKILMLKMKRDQIEQENEQLRKKIQKINTSTMNENQRRKLYSENQRRKASYSVSHHLGEPRKNRYDKQEQLNGIEVSSDCGDGDNIKCFIPPPQNKIKCSSISQNKALNYNAVIFNLREKQKIQNKENQQKQADKKQQKENPQGTEQNKDRQQSQHKQKNPSITILQNNPKLKNMIRESSALTKDQLLYGQPERQPHRIVLFKKTKIPYPMVSFLVEISLIDNRLLLTACGMGLVDKDFKYLFSSKKTKQLLQQSKGNYENIWDQVQIDPQTGIKFTNLNYNQTPTELDPYEIQGTKQKNIQQQKYQITQNFLQRNYYTLLKQSKTKQKQENSIPVTHFNKQKVTEESSTNNTNLNSKDRKSILRNKIQFNRQKISDENSQNYQKTNINIKQAQTVTETKVLAKKVQEKGYMQKVGANSSTRRSVAKVQQTNKVQKQKVKGWERKKSEQVKKQNKQTMIKLDKQIKTNKANEQKDQKVNKNGQSKDKKKTEQKLKSEAKSQNQYQQQFDVAEPQQANNMAKNASNTGNDSKLYEQSFENENDNEKQEEKQDDIEYEQQFESNPSKLSSMNMKNKSQIAGVKRKEIKNNSSHQYEQQIYQFQQEEGTPQKGEQAEKNKINNNSKVHGKEKEKKKKEEIVEEEYLEQFQN